jgi:hypothetical protein
MLYVVMGSKVSLARSSTNSGALIGVCAGQRLGAFDVTE